MRTKIFRLMGISVVAAVGWAAGWLVAVVGHTLPQPSDYPFLVEYTPLPHHVPKYRDGLSFRFTMAHDVIHERFPKHGPAFYRERNRRTREALAALGADDPARFPLCDDLGAGLERLGKSEEAVAVLREKLASQQAKGLSGRALYTSYANLGTFLIHGSFKQAFAGDADARKRFREGVEFIHKSVEVNPEAHFGREQWQSVIAEFLLAASDSPGLLRTFDCLGNRLDLGIEEILNREGNWVDTGYGRPTDAPFSQAKVDNELPAFFQAGWAVGDPTNWDKLKAIRAHITKVGAEREWDALPIPEHQSPVAFDEPMLGIIGMWRQGGGANPHFALAIGETMLRTGQRYIAWEAFERTSRMADRFSPDPALRQFLVDHCRTRQGHIENTLSFRETSGRRLPWQAVSPPPRAESLAKLRSNFNAELAFGEGYQHAYQDYEAKKIAAGVSITDADFFDEFHASHPSVASPSGEEEWFARVPRARMEAYESQRRRAYAVLGAGVAAMAAAFLSRFSRTRARARAANVLSSCPASTA